MPVGERDELLAHAHLGPLGQVGGDHRVARRRRGAIDAGDGRVVTEGGRLREIKLHQLGPRLGGAPLHGGRDGGQRQHTVHRGVGESVEAGGHLLALFQAADGDDLVDRAQLVVGRGPDRSVDGVAHDQRPGDDRRAQHAAQHHQQGLDRATHRIAQRQPPRHRTQGQHHQCRQRHHQHQDDGGHDQSGTRSTVTSLVI
ncbi:MAG: hypothetical protein OEW42_11740 [Acidimicrobiia bacterium]|nr:hypothetical protein [Acidimicrobiia bacterium]